MYSMASKALPLNQNSLKYHCLSKSSWQDSAQTNPAFFSYSMASKCRSKINVNRLTENWILLRISEAEEKTRSNEPTSPSLSKNYCSLFNTSANSEYSLFGSISCAERTLESNLSPESIPKVMPKIEANLPEKKCYKAQLQITLSPHRFDFVPKQKITLTKLQQILRREKLSVFNKKFNHCTPNLNFKRTDKKLKNNISTNIGRKWNGRIKIVN